MTLLYFSWNSLWFGWKFHLHLERNCHLCSLRFLPNHSYSLAISLARFPSNFLPHSLPSSWNGYTTDSRLFSAHEPAEKDTWPQGLCARKPRWWLTVASLCLLSRINFVMDQGMWSFRAEVMFQLAAARKSLTAMFIAVFWLKWTSDR